MEEKSDEKRLGDILKASCSLPFIGPIAYVDGPCSLCVSGNRLISFLSLVHPATDELLGPVRSGA